MKKRYITKTLLLSLALGFFSCENELNELRPEQSLTGETAFASEATTKSTLFGVYSTLQNYEVYGSLPQVIADYQADNVEFVGSFPTLQEIANYSVVASNSSIRDLWAIHYRAILRANKVIAKVPAVEDVNFTEAEKAQVIAEAKFLRALLYFQLSNLFSQPYQISGGTNLSVPLVLESFEGEVTLPARETLNAVHAQIEKDLVDAIPGLLNASEFSDPSEMRGRATKGAARALLSRLYLYRDDYANAEKYAREVLTSPEYALAPDYSFYNANTSEDIFTIQNSPIDNGRTGAGGWASYYRPAAEGGRGDAPFSEDLLAAYNEEPGDKRLTELSSVGEAADTEEHYFTTKFSDAATNSDNAPVIRVTEVVLTLAEAIAKQNGVQLEAIELVNQLRERAGLSEWTIASFTSKEAFVDAILNERRKELAFEGHRRMDLLRNKMPLRTSGEGVEKAAFGGDYTILPIPQRERDVNPSLEPNPGY
jgi:hypothetical protein